MSNKSKWERGKGVFAVIGAGIPLDRSVLELILYSVSVRIGKVC